MFYYRTITFCSSPFQTICKTFRPLHWCPQPPSEDGFGLIRFRSPLLTESRLLSFPPDTEMFQFSGFASIPYAFRYRFPINREGCPIRTSQDHSSVTSFPGLFAGSHVLHRLSTPRHPPHALHNFVTTTRSRQWPLGTKARIESTYRYQNYWDTRLCPGRDTLKRVPFFLP